MTYSYFVMVIHKLFFGVQKSVACALCTLFKVVHNPSFLSTAS